MSQGLRKLTAIISKSRTSVIFLNQLRQKIGVAFGNPETTTGGNALKFYASVRLDVRRINALKSDEAITGSRTRVRVVKNKLAPPFRQAEFDILHSEGISRLNELLDLAVEQELVAKSGAWFSYQGTRIGQGRETTKAFLQTSQEIVLALEAQVRHNLGLSMTSHTTERDSSS
jgi:recombination protein RecA